MGGIDQDWECGRHLESESDGPRATIDLPG